MRLPPGHRQFTEEERELTRRWLETWKRAGPMLDELRWQRVAALADDEAWREMSELLLLWSLR